MKKYLFDLDTDITESNLLKFIQDFKKGTLQRYLKSEDIPDKNDGPVKVIVANSWDSIVTDSNKDVFVMFYAPWCGYCKKLSPTWEQVAKSLSNNKNIVIAKLDVTENETPGLAIETYPTLGFFSGKKDQRALVFEGERNYESIIQYLKEKTSHPWVEPKVEL